MEKGTHGKLEQTFEECDFVGQSRVINGQIQTIVKSIKAHVRKADEERSNGNINRDSNKTLLKCIKLLSSAINQVTP